MRVYHPQRLEPSLSSTDGMVSNCSGNKNNTHTFVVQVKSKRHGDFMVEDADSPIAKQQSKSTLVQSLYDVDRQTRCHVEEGKNRRRRSRRKLPKQDEEHSPRQPSPHPFYQNNRNDPWNKLKLQLLDQRLSIRPLDEDATDASSTATETTATATTASLSSSSLTRKHVTRKLNSHLHD